MTVSDHDPWWTRTACHDAPDEIFFPETERRYNGTDAYELARPYCARCPVAAECLADALRTEAGGGRVTGFCGGRTPRERADLRKVRVLA